MDTRPNPVGRTKKEPVSHPDHTGITTREALPWEVRRFRLAAALALFYGVPALAQPASAADVIAFKLTMGAGGAVVFLAIPLVCYACLRTRSVKIPVAAVVFLVSSTSCGMAWLTYAVVLLFAKPLMPWVASFALVMMVVTIIILLVLIPALVGLFDPERERLASIVDSSQDAIIGKNMAGIITNWNAGAERLYGFTRDEALGQHISIIIPPSRQEELDQILARVERGEIVDRLETERRRKDGRKLWVSLSLSPVRNKRGEIVGASAIGRDITERRIMEQQLARSNKELDDFAYIASHDLKSPLRGIDNLCRFVVEDLGESAPTEVRKHLDQLRGRVNRMERLLDDLLEYSRVGRKAGKPTWVDVESLIDNIAQMLDVPATFSIAHTGNLPRMFTEAPPLEQVFRNLIGNAIKHHDREAGSVVIDARRLDDHTVEFSVVDDGPGIDDRFRERIFRMFTTLVPRDKVEGSGLGLSLVEKQVMRHGGRVWYAGYANGVDRGAVFKFTWHHSEVEQAA